MTSPARVRAGLTLALTTALAVGAVPATQAASPSTTPSATSDGANFKVRAVNAMVHAASLRRAMLTSSASVDCLSRGTATAPARRMPKYATGHSGRFSETSRTRRCGCTPSLSR